MSITTADLCSPARYAEAVSGGKFQRPRHIQALDAEVMATLLGDYDILVAMAPPRSGKSEYLSKWLPSWYTNAWSSNRVISTSYSLSLARIASRFARDQNHKDAPIWGRGGVNRLVSGATDWQTVDGGGMLAAGVGGGITGRAANLFLIDDCLKNAEQALSERVRESQWEWWQTTAFTRLEPGAKMIILGTRWHESDLLGKVLDFATKETNLRVREVRFQAIAELEANQTDILGRSNGEALWPERWPVEALLRIKSALADYWWQALYQQNLTQHSSNEWPESYFWGVLVEPENWPENLVLSATALDPSKGKDAKKGDFQAIVNTGYRDGYLWVECEIDRQPISEMIDDLVRFNMRVRPTVTGIEAVAFQELLAPVYIQAQMDYSYYDQPELIQNTTPKRIRIARLGYWLRRHRIKIKNNAAGQLLLKQLKSFPNGDHDDGCFIAGTNIATDSGKRPIESIAPGDLVATRNGLRSVIESECTGVKEVFEYLLSDGSTIACTSNHPFYDGHSFSPIRSISQVMKCQETTQLQNPFALHGMESTSGDTQTPSNGVTGFTIPHTLDTEEQESKHCIKRYGSQFMDQSLKGKRFTTSTRTLTTTQSKISNASPRKSMTKSTQILDHRGRLYLTTPGKLRANGTSQMPVDNGIENMLRKSHRAFSLLMSSAISVESHIKQKHHTERNSALQDADRDVMPLTSLRVLKSTSIGLRKVYNLTVEGGEYIANGLIVHNCDALEMSIRLLLQVCDQLQDVMQADGGLEAAQILEP